jgi:undecaprenyl pyrophosphate phosphatase UppP
MDDGLDKRFWLKTVGAIVGLGVLGLLSFLVFTGLVWRLGAIGALIVVFGVLLLVTNRVDKKRQREYDDD